MKIFIKKIDDDGNIEISAFKNINAGNDFDSLLYPPEDVCIKSEEINIFDLLEENKKLKKENDILLNVQEDCEKSLHKIRELKRELNKVNEENKRLKEQIEDLLTQQKEFTKFLEDELLDVRYYARNIAHYIEYVLRKYKEIVNGTEQK